jgi:hypothetical protein
LNTLEFILGPVSVIAIFAGVVSYGLGRTDDRHRVATVLFALIVAALWAGVGLFIAVAVWLPKGCLG